MKNKHFILKMGKRKTLTPIKVFNDPKVFKILSNDLAWKIFKELSTPQCPIDIAKKLGIHEQKIYYYIRKFKTSGLIQEVGEEGRHGTIAKFYQIKNHAFCLKLESAPEEEIQIHSPLFNKNLEPFVLEGKLNSRIIVGSPDPHGPWKAQASDGSCAIDFALFLGSFTAGIFQPNYKLDTEIREKDLKGNLILIGGPTVNMVTKKVNKKLPIFFDLKNSRDIISKISGKKYEDESCGLIALIDNPWIKTKKNKILILAGKRVHGTRAAIIAFIKDLDKIMEGNKFNRKIKARVVKGYDTSGDGIIDDFEILE